jgi:hypothetical protein
MKRGLHHMDYAHQPAAGPAVVIPLAKSGPSTGEGWGRRLQREVSEGGPTRSRCRPASRQYPLNSVLETLRLVVAVAARHAAGQLLAARRSLGGDRCRLSERIRVRRLRAVQRRRELIFARLLL